MGTEPARAGLPPEMTRLERMLCACRGEPTDRPPVWLMRQAGRYLPEYRELRARTAFLELCRDPELALEVSLQPYRRFGMDAVIVFSDILLPFQGLGLKLDFSPGPRVENPLRSERDLARLEGSVAEAMAPTCETIRALKAVLGDETAVIGFAGAPWTLAAYACETTLSRDLAVLNALSYREPALLDRMLERMAEITTESLRLQIEAGADVLQIFDTWAGTLSSQRYRRFAGRALGQVLAALPSPRPPLILFARAATHLIEELAALGPDVVSLDWRVDLQEAAARIGGRVALQGNLDPAALLAPAPEIRKEVERLIRAGRKACGHVLNLGHGVLPTTPVESVAAFVEAAQHGTP
ncbi:MAG: uroporphyrinogen decarboxylase [Deltaproteobacteria bacterium]|nr:MAG: uroporphyrinogen decarboxylase [Deltaproteobacteria bacterium]